MACCCCQGPGICCNGTECTSVNACECGANGGTFRKGSTLTCNPVICQDAQGNQTIANNPCACTGTNVCSLSCMPRTSLTLEIITDVAPEINGTKTLQLTSVGNYLTYTWGEDGLYCVFCDPCNRFTPTGFSCARKNFWAVNVMHNCTFAGGFGGLGHAAGDAWVEVNGINLCVFCGSSFGNPDWLSWHVFSQTAGGIWKAPVNPLWWCANEPAETIEQNRVVTFGNSVYGSATMRISP